MAHIIEKTHVLYNEYEMRKNRSKPKRKMDSKKTQLKIKRKNYRKTPE